MANQALTTTCVDLCASCSSAVRTFANLQIVGDEKYLAPTYMPPGGCTCLSMAVDLACPRCFPAELLCQPCGERPSTPGSPGRCDGCTSAYEICCGASTTPGRTPGGAS